MLTISVIGRRCKNGSIRLVLIVKFTQFLEVQTRGVS